MTCKVIDMCKYCDYDSGECCIFKNSLTNEWYIDIETSEWDEYGDDWIHQKEYISYCPYCGRKLRQ